MSNIREIQSRGAVTIVIAEEGTTPCAAMPITDRNPLGINIVAAVVVHHPLQVFAASVAQARGYGRQAAKTSPSLRHAGISGHSHAGRGY